MTSVTNNDARDVVAHQGVADPPGIIRDARTRSAGRGGTLRTERALARSGPGPPVMGNRGHFNTPLTYRRAGGMSLSLLRWNSDQLRGTPTRWAPTKTDSG